MEEEELETGLVLAPEVELVLVPVLVLAAEVVPVLEVDV